jgi:hypothetical protein
LTVHDHRIEYTEQKEENTLLISQNQERLKQERLELVEIVGSHEKHNLNGKLSGYNPLRAGVGGVKGHTRILLWLLPHHQHHQHQTP